MSLQVLSQLVQLRQHLFQQVNGLPSNLSKTQVNPVNKLIVTIDQYIVTKSLSMDLSKLDDYEMLLNHNKSTVEFRSTDEEFDQASKRVLAARTIEPAGKAVAHDGVVTIVATDAVPVIKEAASIVETKPAPSSASKPKKKGSFKRTGDFDDSED